MPEEDLSPHQKVAQAEARDEKGHFVYAGQQKPISAAEAHARYGAKNPVSHFLADHSHYSRSQDDILDIHIGNPLRKITQLLEEIKRQKAFNFTLKGSLGIMGLFLTLSVFGIFGGGQILCDRGTQVEIGTIRQLQSQEEDNTSKIPLLSQFLDYFRPVQLHPKFVLIKNDETVIQLSYTKSVDLTRFTNNAFPQLSQKIIATGNYNSCSRTLTIKSPSAIEAYNK